jgi:hypothetical protein
MPFIPGTERSDNRSDQRSHERSEQRSRSLSYAPITNIFNEKTCMVDEIDMPSITRNVIIPVFVTKDKSLQNYRVKERREIVDFKVRFIPINNSNGKKLLINAKQIVDSVLKKDFKPQVAVITSFRNGVIEQTINVNDTIVKKCSIELDKDDFIHISFELEGLLDAKY